ncbi:MAG TPA: hypothetical protein VKV04_06995, partial [Verrucomicrobiae bacterium]|nr:hypothetical protein [Verrucomicrobiae bacterium]
MKTKARKSARRTPEFPKRIKEGNAEVTIYRQRNPSRRRDPESGEWELTGKVFDEYVLAYYQGTRDAVDKKTGKSIQLPKLVRQKFGKLSDAEAKAESVVRKLANLQGEALKLTNAEALAWIEVNRDLRQWNPDAKLTLVVADYIRNMKRLPVGVSLDEVLGSYLSRHPAGLPKKSVREVVDDLLLVKTNTGVSKPYAKELRLRLGQFADAFVVPISAVGSKDIQEWLMNRNVSGRTQNNYRRLISTLFKFAIRRGYLPRDHD